MDWPRLMCKPCHLNYNINNFKSITSNSHYRFFQSIAYVKSLLCLSLHGALHEWMIEEGDQNKWQLYWPYSDLPRRKKPNPHPSESNDLNHPYKTWSSSVTVNNMLSIAVLTWYYRCVQCSPCYYVSTLKFGNLIIAHICTKTKYRTNPEERRNQWDVLSVNYGCLYQLF